MRIIKAHNRSNSALFMYLQLLVIFLAFAIMDIASYFFMENIEREHLKRDIREIFISKQAQIKADLLESEITLKNISQTLRNMLIKGASEKEAMEYMTDLYKYMQIGQENSTIMDIYAYFDIFDGKFVNGANWAPPGDYEPKKRSWYSAAVEANGNIAITKPYKDIQYGEMVIAFSRRIFDDNGKPLAVISIDMKLNDIAKKIVDTDLTESSFGLLLSEDMEFLAHPDSALIGLKIRESNLDIARASYILERDKVLNEFEMKDYKNDESVISARQLDNGWYICVVARKDEYYQGVRLIAKALSVLGIIMAITLGFILVRITKSRDKMDAYTTLMFESIPSSCILIDRNYNIISCNQAALKMFGMPSKEELSKHFLELSPELQSNGRSSKEWTVELIKNTFDVGYVRFEWMHKSVNGELIPCEIIAMRLAYQNEYILAAYQYDLRAQRAALQKVYEDNERMRVMFEASPFAVYLLDFNANIIDCNKITTEFFGMTNKKEFIKNFRYFLPEFQPCGKTSYDKIKEINAEVLAKGSFFINEWVFQKPDGEALPCEVFLMLVKYEGRDAIAAYVRDLKEYKLMLNEKRKAEIAEASNKAKSKFLAAMSHEIRTPMNAILGLAEINMQNEALPKDIQDEFEKIYNSGDLLMRLINDILDLSKIEAGKLELRLGQYSIASLIHDAVQLNITRIGSKQIEFKLNLDENIPSEFIGDELRIKQILNNLLSNAFKYTESGSIILSVAIEPAKESEEAIVIFDVSDTGQGMTSEQLKGLFNEYSRFNLEANRLIQGAGLGLNITKQLVQMMNGEISVSSEPGKGSKFTMRLPQKIASSKVLGPELTKKLLQYEYSDVSKSKKAHIIRELMPYGKVLVVDDVDMNLYIAKVLLKPYELKVETVDSGFAAIEKIEKGNAYDVIFMDHMMPKMDGMEATRRLRDLGYKRPIVMLTANAVAGQAEIFLSNGFDDFISKPIDMRQLNVVLNKFIRDNKKAKKQNTEFAADPELHAIFVRDAKKALAAIEPVFANLDSATDENLRLLTVSVHSMKSNLMNIGEKALSEQAFALEKAGKKRNKDFIKQDMQSFIDKLRAVTEKFEKESSAVGAERDEDPAYLQEQLKIIREASETYDSTAADAAIANLKKMSWTKETGKLIDEISEYLLQGYFEKASELAASRM